MPPYVTKDGVRLPLAKLLMLAGDALPDQLLRSWMPGYNAIEKLKLQSRLWSQNSVPGSSCG